MLTIWDGRAHMSIYGRRVHQRAVPEGLELLACAATRLELDSCEWVSRQRSVTRTGSRRCAGEWPFTAPAAPGAVRSQGGLH